MFNYLLMAASVFVLIGCSAERTARQEVILGPEEVVLFSMSPTDIEKMGADHYRITQSVFDDGDFVLDLYMSDEVHPTDATRDGWPLFHHIRRMVVTVQGDAHVVDPLSSGFKNARFVDISRATVISSVMERQNEQPFYIGLTFSYGTYRQAKECAKSLGRGDDQDYLRLYQNNLDLTVGTSGRVQIELEERCP